MNDSYKTFIKLAYMGIVSCLIINRIPQPITEFSCKRLYMSQPTGNKFTHFVDVVRAFL